MSDKGIVYILSNSAMPDIIKIGITTRDDLSQRMQELYTTSVPVPFECVYACRVENCRKVESVLHNAFDTDRVNPQREFFKTDPDRVIPILQMVETENLTSKYTQKTSTKINTIDIESGERLKRARRPQLDFYQMGIPEGAELVFMDSDEPVIATVRTNKLVSYNNSEPKSLTQVTREILQIDYDIQPTRKWSYNGRNLSEIYNETYPL